MSDDSDSDSSDDKRDDDNDDDKRDDDNEGTPAWMRYLPKVPWSNSTITTKATNTATPTNISTTISIDIDNTNTNDSNTMTISNAKDGTTRLPISNNRFIPSPLINTNNKKRGRDDNNNNNDNTITNDSTNDTIASKRYRRVHVNEAALLLEMFNVNKS